jgi:uncharacterized protein with GYD domain
MPKFLFESRYTADGAKGLEKEGGTGRIDAVKKHLQELGGTLECMYFAFGDVDVYAILDLPDLASAAALSLAVNKSGAMSTKTVVLLTPQELDEASRKTVHFRAPGQ